MNPKFLQVLLEDQLKERSLSVRAAAEQAGVAHTTLARLLRGEAADLETVVKISNWLQVSPDLALNSLGHKENALLSKIGLLFELHPPLRHLFEWGIVRIEQDGRPLEALEEAMNYMVFRLVQVL